jgi:hypothetical protein
MPIFLNPDQIPFWLIVLTSAILWWLRDLWLPLYKKMFGKDKPKPAKEKKDKAPGIETLYRQELFQLAQANHLASALFPLSEITVPPKLQVPTPDYDTENPISHLPLTNEVIPYLPDMPELAAFYNSPTIRIEEVLGSGLNIGLIGKSGSGKTHTLNWLAVEIAQRNPKLGTFSELLPIYIHAADLDLNSTNLTMALCKSWEDNKTILKINELERFFEKYLLERNVIFLVDGLDEVPSEISERYIKFFHHLRNKYPGNKFVVSLSPYDLSALEPLNLYPLSLAYWNEKEKEDFSRKWNSAWEKASKSEIGMSNVISQTPEFIFRKLLLDQGKGLSPFEITLKIWGLYSSKVPCVNICGDLDAYLKVQSHKLKNAPEILKTIASKLYQLKRSIIEISEFTDLERNLIPALINRGILQKRSNSQVGFAHQNIFAYLAAKKLAPIESLKYLTQNISWETSHLIHLYSPTPSSDHIFIDKCISLNGSDPTRTFTLIASKLLRVSTHNDIWLKRLIRLLGVEIQNKELPYSLRIRILSALAFSNLTRVRHLFRKLIESDEPFDILLGLIGAGVKGDLEYIDQIGELLFHELPLVNQTASLILVTLGTNEALDKMAQGFLHASDSAKIIIAEALALNDPEGHQILREGTDVNNPAVRRASVFGLSRIKQDWVREIIEELSQDDEEWLVRNAAADALSLSRIETWKYPKAVVRLDKASWLLNFAAELGVGISSRQAAWKFVESAITKGNQQQKLAALKVFNKVPYKAFNLSSELVDLLSLPDLTMNERAFNLLLSLQALGISIKN